jgi:ketosteroid isomerase-like protein
MTAAAHADNRRRTRTLTWAVSMAMFLSAAPAWAQRGKGDAEAQVLAVERQWNDARAHADVATLERILVDDWTVTHANGTTDSKATYLRDLKSGARTFTGGVAERDLVVRFFGDTAIVAGSSESTVTLNGQPQGGSLHFTRVYVKRDGAWKMAVTQATTRSR